MTATDMARPGSSPMARLTVEDLCADCDETTVLHRATLRVEAGQIHTVLGPDGGGKTTLLHAVAGLIAASGGTITLDGHDVTGLTPLQRARRGVHLVPRTPRLVGRWTVREHLTQSAGAGHDSDVGAILTALPALAGHLHHLPQRLTAEEAAMLSLACALLGQPQLLLLDEPVQDRSATTAHTFTTLITRTAQNGTAVLATARSANHVHPRTDLLSHLHHGVLTAGPPL